MLVRAMKHSLSNLLLTVAGLSRLAQAGDQWYTTTCWETTTQQCPTATAWQECLPSTVYEVSTETQVVYKTVYNEVTTTEYQTVPTTIYQPVPTTVYSDVPTTLVQPVTVYVTQVESVVNSETVYDTVYNTVYNTVENTVTQVETETDTTVQYQTVVVTDTVPTTISVSSVCPTSLTGLVLCPSRIVNPTYTPATPLPTDYIWGCPPGSICQPTKIDCNFEQGPPADTYYCPPDQCEIAGPLPSIEEVLNNPPLGTNCAWLIPDPGYFDLAPLPFGYTYGIFNIFGQPQCPASCPPQQTATVVETQPAPPPATIYNTIVQTEQAPPPATVYNTIVETAQAPPPATVYVTVTVTVTVAPPPSTYYPPPSSTWQTWSQPAPVKPTPSVWSSWGAKMTARANLDARALFFPKPCYNLANYAQKIFQSIGSQSARLCPTDGPFSIAYSYASECYSLSSTVMPSAQVTRLSSALSYCSAHPVRKREVNEGIVFPRRIRQA